MSLTDAQWARVEPLLPERRPRRGGCWRGGCWRDHRQVIDAIAFTYRTGTPWMSLPEHFGSWKGAHNRLRMWATDGTWRRFFIAVLAQADAEGDVDWVVAVDSTIVRAHQHAAGARNEGAPAAELVDHTLGRSRGGVTAKIHLAADGQCRPLAFVITAGQAGDAPAFEQVMAWIRVPRRVGRTRTTPVVVLADRAYSSRAILCHLRRRGIRSVIPQPADQAASRKRRGRLGGRAPAFDREAYKRRTTVERCINKLEQWRGLATRYEKTATIYLVDLHLAAVFIWSAN
ncbi:IS5 family transposase [Streptomyces sp. NBC_00620]|uniref:IS5 family transposase n=1 Tax=Streptomyces sp. NBC_00620 TaxID=2903666 RepID=UPI00224DF9D2|nr:IS5 family transposase [Streptomyces sp. NBC_00620]MCX4973385.1 IS5 family transposase [Streptomyces sp. NBC_00620]